MVCSIPNDSLLGISPFYFLFDGVFYEIKPEKLFYKLEQANKYTFQIRFFEALDDLNIWIFGYPIFSSYEIKLDYDKNVIGFKGGRILDISEEYSKWKEKNSNSFFKIISNPIVLGIIIAIVVILILFIILSMLRKSCIQRKENNELLKNEDNKL